MTNISSGFIFSFYHQFSVIVFRG